MYVLGFDGCAWHGYRRGGETETPRSGGGPSRRASVRSMSNSSVFMFMVLFMFLFLSLYLFLFLYPMRYAPVTSAHARVARCWCSTPCRVSKVQTFFGEFVNKGNVGVIEDLFDDECVHVDMVWGSLYPSVGHVGMAHYLEDLRTTFPDFHIGVDNLKLAQASLNSLWVRLEGNCTGLGSYHDHKASGHANHFDAVVLFEFNKDRSKITHIEVFRTAFAEDREDLTTVVKEGGFRDLRLKRLMD